MFKKITIILCLLTLSACNLEENLFPSQHQSFEEGEKIWAFIQYHIPEKEGGFEDYYYFGLVSENLYKKIRTHQIKDGLIFMENVKYWNTEDIIESYEDEIYKDEMAFRIEDIVRFEMVKSEPVDGFTYDSDNIIEDVVKSSTKQEEVSEEE
jgi:hypothetical protein